MTIKLILGIALSLLATSVALASNNVAPASRMRTQLQQVADKQCNAAKSLQASATSEDDKAVAAMMHAANCTCLPAEIDQSLASHENADRLTRQVAGKLLQDAAAVCHARQQRERAEAICLLDKQTIGTAKDRPSYCKCYASGIRSLSDTQIIESSMAVHAAFEASVRARTKGEAAPAKPHTAMTGVEETCRQSPDAYR